TPPRDTPALHDALPICDGVFDVLFRLVRRRLGGRVGSGKQYVSWIHHLDFVRAVRWLIESDMTGPVNICAPNPLPYADFIGALRSEEHTSELQSRENLV